MPTFVRRVVVVVFMFLLVPLPVGVNAQQRQPTSLNIYVEYGSTDRVGIDYVFELREQLRASRRYELTTSKDQALFALHIVSMDVNKDAPGESSAVAVTLTISPGTKDTYVDTWILLVGRQRTRQMAKSLFAAIDADVETRRKELQK